MVSSKFDVPIDNFSQSTIFEKKLGHSYSLTIMNYILGRPVIQSTKQQNYLSQILV